MELTKPAAQANYNLIDFLKTFGINTTTNFDLYSIADFLNLDLEICMKNEILNLGGMLESHVNTNNNIPNLIINYQNSNQKGTHWVAFAKGAYYFDSFGLKPLEQISKHVKKYNEIKVQYFGTKICGILCIYFLYKMNERSEFTEIINKMKNLYDKLIP